MPSLNFSYSGIIIVDSDNITIIGNVAVDLYDSPQQKYGLESTGTSDYLVLIGNIFTPNYTGNYSLVGSHDIIYGNR